MLHDLLHKLWKHHGLLEKSAAGHQVSGEPRISPGAVIGITVFAVFVLSAMILLWIYAPMPPQTSPWMPY